mgnify:CR=1 FL=1
MPKETKKTEIKLLQNKLKENMILFGSIINANMFSVPSPDFHYEIAKVLMNDDNKQVNIIAPRGHAKSSIVGGVSHIAQQRN